MKKLDPRLFSESLDLIDLTPPFVSDTSTSEKSIRDLKEQLSKQVLNAEANVSEIRNQLAHKVSVLEKKMDILVDKFQNFADVANQRHAQSQSQIQSTKIDSSRVEALIERQNQIVAVYESRLKKFQHMLEKQELKILDLSAQLSESRRQLERLKGL